MSLWWFIVASPTANGPHLCGLQSRSLGEFKAVVDQRTFNAASPCGDIDSRLGIDAICDLENA